MEYQEIDQLIENLSMAEKEMNKCNAALLDWCKDKKNSLCDRFGVWKNEVNKSHEETIPSIVDAPEIYKSLYQLIAVDKNQHEPFDYWEFIECFINQPEYRNLSEEERYNNSDFQTLLEYIIEQNIVTFRYDW